MNASSSEVWHSVMVFVGVGVGGGLGSVLRLVMGKWAGKGLPIGILAANTIASALVAYVSVWHHDWLWAAVSAGVAGGLSTFSTWAAQTAELWAAGERADALNNALLNLLLPTVAVLVVLVPRLFGAF